MKLSIGLGMAAVAGVLAAGGSAAAAPTCVATCNAANMQCAQANKDQAVCLRAWHQCKVGCTASSTPATLTVTKPSPGTVVIKSATPKPAKH